VCTVISELLCCASVSESKLRGKSSSRRGPRGHGRGQYPRKDTKVSLIAVVDVLSDVLLVSHLVLLLLKFGLVFLCHFRRTFGAILQVISYFCHEINSFTSLQETP